MAVTAEDGERGEVRRLYCTYTHAVTYFMAVMCETLGKIDEGLTPRCLYVHRLNMEVDLQSLFGLHVT
jgi:hypothetical protein